MMDEQPGRLAVIGLIARKVGAACALPFADVALVALAWVLIGAASSAIVLVPSRRILRTLGSNLGTVTHAPTSDMRQRQRARRITRAIEIAARNAPFRANCYPQALAAAQLCRWFAVPHAVQLGARFAAGDGAGGARALQGHAWVSGDVFTICGGSDSAQAFGTVACFVHIPHSGSADAVA